MTPLTVAHQASVHRILQARYWSGLSFPSPEELSNPGTEPWSSASQADSLPFEVQGSLRGTFNLQYSSDWSIRL